MSPTETAAPFAAERRAAVANMVFKATSMTLEKGSRLVFVVVAARALGEAAFGRYQFAFTATRLLALMADLGLHMWTIRALARDRARAPTVIWTALRMRAFVVPTYVLALTALALFAGPGEIRVAMIWLGAAALVNALVDYGASIFRGLEQLAKEGVLNVARALLTTAAALLALRLDPTLRGLCVGLLAGTIASLVFGVVALGGSLRRLMPPSARFEYDRDLAARAAREAWPLWFATLLSWLYFRGDVVILRPFAGDAAVGAYSAAYRIFENLMVVPTIVMAAAFPPLARAHGDRARQRRWERLLVAVLLGLGCFVGGAVGFGADRLVPLLFGPSYGDAIPSLQVLALALPLLFLNFGLTHFLIARDRERRNLAFAGIALVVNVTANLLLIPRLAGVGAAWATLLTEVALTTCCLLALRGSGDGR